LVDYQLNTGAFAPDRRLRLSGIRARAFAAAPTVLAALAVIAVTGPGVAHAQIVCTAGGGTATGVNATACGPNAAATGDSSTAVGLNSTAAGLEATAEGFTNEASGRGANAIGGRNKATNTFSTAVGWANTASGLDSIAAGNKSIASGISSVAVGDVAVASGDNSVAIGLRATATAANSVAIGTDSVANQANTVSVGSAANQRRITNVAAGTSATDAATFGQLQTSFADLAARIDGVDQRGDQGTAAAMAIAGLPQAFAPGKGFIAIAVGNWRDETAFAVGASKVFGQRTVFKAGAAFDSHGTGGANAGIGWQF
jgi:autotransporter adhesin